MTGEPVPAIAWAPGLALLLAWTWDLRFGEPRNVWHPVAWLGRILWPLGERLAASRPAMAFAGGALAWLVLASALGAAAWAWQRAALAAPAWLAVPALALWLKPTFAWRMLRDEVAAVEAALQVEAVVPPAGPTGIGGGSGGNDVGSREDVHAAGEAGLRAARRQLARLVSRDVSAAPVEALRETAIETLAENLNDSLVAPLFWFAVAGLPGAVVYRLANTADAMWGYRGRFEWAGKWAARADDVLSWLPARLTAALLWRGSDLKSLQALRSQAMLTPSPNGGWPMGAMALRLGVCLRKPGVYALNAGAAPPGQGDVPRALRAAGAAAWAAVVLCGLACMLRAVWP